MEMELSAISWEEPSTASENPLTAWVLLCRDKVRTNINGLPLNPVTREYPRNYIHTGISAIDGLTTLIRGQKLPIFSGNGLPHDQLAAQIVQQASLGDIPMKNSPLYLPPWVLNTTLLNFSAVPLRRAALSDHVVMFLNLANDPVVEATDHPESGPDRCGVSGI